MYNYNDTIVSHAFSLKCSHSIYCLLEVYHVPGTVLSVLSILSFDGGNIISILWIRTGNHRVGK